MAAARRAALDDRAELQFVSPPSTAETNSENKRTRTAVQIERDRAMKALSVDWAKTEDAEFSPSMPSNSPASARRLRSMT